MDPGGRFGPDGIAGARRHGRRRRRFRAASPPLRHALADQSGSIEITADRFGLPLADDGVSRLYADPSVALAQGDAITFLRFPCRLMATTRWRSTPLRPMCS